MDTVAEEANENDKPSADKKSSNRGEHSKSESCAATILGVLHLYIYYALLRDGCYVTPLGCRFRGFWVDWPGLDAVVGMTLLTGWFGRVGTVWGTNNISYIQQHEY